MDILRINWRTEVTRSMSNEINKFGCIYSVFGPKLWEYLANETEILGVKIKHGVHHGHP